jgi:hypothetical protein
MMMMMMMMMMMVILHEYHTPQGNTFVLLSSLLKGKTGSVMEFQFEITSSIFEYLLH